MPVLRGKAEHVGNLNLDRIASGTKTKRSQQHFRARSPCRIDLSRFHLTGHLIYPEHLCNKEQVLILVGTTYDLIGQRADNFF